MKINIPVLICLVISVVVGSSCRRPHLRIFNRGACDLQKVDDLVRVQPEYASLDEATRIYCAALLDRHLDNLYMLRSEDFHAVVSKEVYCHEIEAELQKWSLDEYSVLAIRLYGSNRARFIVRTVEYGITNYNVAMWVREGSGWRCSATGLSRLSFSDPLIGNE